MEMEMYEERFYKARNLLRKIRDITFCPEGSDIYLHIKGIMDKKINANEILLPPLIATTKSKIHKQILKPGRITDVLFSRKELEKILKDLEAEVEKDLDLSFTGSQFKLIGYQDCINDIKEKLYENKRS